VSCSIWTLLAQLVCDQRVGSGMSSLWWTTILGMRGCSFSRIRGETFHFVRDLVLSLRNERHGDAIRAIRSDNGSEFRNSRFETFCHDFALAHQFSSLYTPPQNGVVERKNRTLCEMARRMLDEHRTLRRYWAEVVNMRAMCQTGCTSECIRRKHATS
jgi:transposase InsO family protein